MTDRPSLAVVAMGTTRDGLSRLALDLLALDGPLGPRGCRPPADRAVAHALVEGSADERQQAARTLVESSRLA